MGLTLRPLSPKTFDEWSWTDLGVLRIEGDGVKVDTINYFLSDIAGWIEDIIPYGENAVVVLEEFAKESYIDFDVRKIGVVKLEAFEPPDDSKEAFAVQMTFDFADELLVHIRSEGSPKRLRVKWSKFLRGLADDIEALREHGEEEESA